MLFVVVIVSKCTKIFPSSNFVLQIFIKIWKKILKRNLLSQHSHFFPKPFAKFWEINLKKNVFGHILIVLLFLKKMNSQKLLPFNIKFHLGCYPCYPMAWHLRFKKKSLVPSISFMNFCILFDHDCKLSHSSSYLLKLWKLCTIFFNSF